MSDLTQVVVGFMSSTAAGRKEKVHQEMSRAGYGANVAVCTCVYVSWQWSVLPGVCAVPYTGESVYKNRLILLSAAPACWWNTMALQVFILM